MTVLILYNSKFPEIRRSCRTCLANFEIVRRRAFESAVKLSSELKSTICPTRHHHFTRHFNLSFSAQNDQRVLEMSGQEPQVGHTFCPVIRKKFSGSLFNYT